jgi:hypothetical protein
MIMRKILKTSVASLALISIAGTAALAQSSTTSGSQPGQMATDFTCAQFVALDEERLERAVYYLAGYKAAQRDLGMSDPNSASAGAAAGADTTASAGSSGTTAPATGTDTGATASAGSSGATGTTTSSATGTDTTASATTGSSAGGTDTASSGTSGSTTTDTAATADASNSASTDTTTTAGTTAGATSASGSASSGAMAGGDVPGLMELPVEQVVIACRASPESRASDMVDQQQGGASAQ